MSESKIKIYLDTNTVIDFFINEAKVLKSGGKPKIPEKFRFMISKAEDIDFITSSLTKAEIVRELASAFNMTKEDIEPVWNGFISALNCKVIDEYKFDQRMIDIVYKFKMRLRTMINFMHLFIAMEQNAYFLSGDKDIINKVRENNIYDKTLTYIELRQKFD